MEGELTFGVVNTPQIKGFNNTASGDSWTSTVVNTPQIKGFNNCCYR